jgi:hypothetical protein
MESQQVLQAWRADLAHLCSVKERVGWLEVQTPLSTITNAFVRVFVRHQEHSDTYIVSDNGDLSENEYEVGDEDYPLQGLVACGRSLLGAGHFDTIKQEGEIFCGRAKGFKMLTSAIFEMAQFIQLTVNMAAMAT